ncbi:MAG: hypothetical protein KDA42_14770 [Planctomycetales bacterium]|nr:hypothetical protein [Planctomycetales bacterium]
MLLGFSTVDFATLAFCLLLLLVIGSYFSSRQRSTREFLLASRSFDATPAGLSLAATTLPVCGLLLLPTAGYWIGFRPIVLCIAMWLSALVMLPFILPLYSRLAPISVYAYLEHRFSRSVRNSALLIFVLWRVAWLGCLLAVASHLLSSALHSPGATVALVAIGGAIVTFYVFLGGLRAVVWTDAAAIGLLVAGLALAIVCSGPNGDGPQTSVWEVAQQLHRDSALQLTTDSGWLQSPWLVWLALPSMILWVLSLQVADQSTVQRLLAAKDETSTSRAYIVYCAVATILIPMCCYLGLAMLAYFQQQPERLQPYWVVNAATDATTGELLQDPNTRAPYIRPDTDIARDLDSLLAAGAILNPNTNEVETDGDRYRRSTGEVDASSLATIDPIPNTPYAEYRIRRGEDQILPTFLGQILPAGLGGLIFGALLIAGFSAFDSGIHSASTLLYIELIERSNWGSASLARWRKKQPQDLDSADELWLVRRLIIAIGALTTLLGLIFAAAGGDAAFLLGLSVTWGGPLLAVFLLGVFTRASNATGVQVALIVGTLVAVGLAIWNSLRAPTVRDPLFSQVWPITINFLATFLVGWVASLAIGQRKTRDELRGLVYGLGKLGVRPEVVEEAMPEDALAANARWR